MSLENNRNILLGSIMQSLDKRLILGDTLDNSSLVLLNILVDSIEYCMNQYNATRNQEYSNKIKVLNKLVQKLKHQCPDVCIYKDRLIITKNYNTSPTIGNNTIEIPISNSHQVLNYKDVVYNYNDAENDLISQVVILSKESDGDLLIDNNPAIINNIYQPNTSFSIKYDAGPNNIFIIKNGSTEPCGSNIICVDKTEYNNAIQNHNVVDINSVNGTTVFQTIKNNVRELPNDTIIYIHIDTSSIVREDQETIKNVVLDWWAQFQTNNPTFQGSLLINTVPNDQISTDFAPGRGGNDYVRINGSNIKTTATNQDVEEWLENPAEGLLRQAYKEGKNDFADEAAFQTWIQNKSLVVLTFVAETADKYHGHLPIGFIHDHTGGVIKQPTTDYIIDYNNYLLKVRPYLAFFKGVLYPITHVNEPYYNNFLLHALAAIEATTLTNTQIDTFFGPAKVAAYGPTNMQNYFYNNLNTNNPYSNLNGLKASGWEGKYDKTAPVSAVLESQEFADELNSILTDSSNVQVSVLEEKSIPSRSLGNNVESKFTLKVKDDNPVQPLYSSVAEVTVRFTSECENTPNCSGGTNSQVSTRHKRTYTFNANNFTNQANVDKIKVTSINIPNGQLKYYNLSIISLNLPIVIPIQDIIDGHLTYIPDDTIQGSYIIQLGYVLAFTGSHNYCINKNIVELTKLENSNKPPTVTTEDKNIVLPTTTATINTTVNYTGAGGYQVFWTKISGASDVQMLNPTSKDLQLANLKAGSYQFKITVVTIEDNFLAEASSNVNVTT